MKHLFLRRDENELFILLICFLYLYIQIVPETLFEQHQLLFENKL